MIKKGIPEHSLIIPLFITTIKEWAKKLIKFSSILLLQR